MRLARLFAVAVTAASLLPLVAAASSEEARNSAAAKLPYRCENPPPGRNKSDTLPPPKTPYDGLLFGGHSPAPISVYVKKPTDDDEHVYIALSHAQALFDFLYVTAESAGTRSVTITGRESVVPTCTVILDLSDRTVNIVKKGQPNYTRPVSTDTPLLLDRASNELLLPVRLIAETFGAKVVWCHPSLLRNDVARCYLRRIALERLGKAKYVEAIFVPGRRVLELSIKPPYVAVDPGTPVPYHVSLKSLIPPSGTVKDPNVTVRVTPGPSGFTVDKTVITPKGINEVVVTPKAGTPPGDYTVTPVVSNTNAPYVSTTPTATLAVKEHRLDVQVTPPTVYQNSDVNYTLKRTQTFPTPKPKQTPDIAPYPNGTVIVSPAPGITTNPATMTIHVAPDAKATTYTVTPVKDPQDTRNINAGPAATFTVLGPSCNWHVPSYVRRRDGEALLPDKDVYAKYISPQPSVLPTPVPTMPNPKALLDAQNIVHAPGGDNTGTVRITGGGCDPADLMVKVIVTSLQHSVAVDYGRASVYDELSPGNDDWNKLLAHAELQISKSAWLSVDARSIGYRHDARSAVPLACPPAPPAPATGGAPPGDEGCVTVAGGASQTYRTAFIARDTSTEVRGGFSLGQSAPVAELAYMTASNNAFRPSVSGLGAALEVPPLLSQPVAAYGALSYYPRVSGGGISYHVLRYRAGVTYTLQPKAPSSLFLELAAVGDRRTNASNAPSSSVYQAISLGLGVKF